MQIARFLEREFSAMVNAVDTFDEAIEELRLQPYALVLVNRVSDLDGSSGLELIRSLKKDAALEDLPVMLVSDRADAQQAAVALGALPGFGKAELRQPRAREAVERALSSLA
jgi:two-component system chemotaxis response regulator CheY